MSKNKKQKNGFFYFMLDMKDELRRQGRNVPMNQMSVLAGPRWSQLPENQRAVYNLRAKHEKRTGYTFDKIQIMSRPGRMDCMGELLSERRDPMAEQQEKRRKQKEYLNEILPVKKDIVLMKFYLLDIQPLCHLKDIEKDKYLPCEMALLEYTLAKGIHQSVHHFIDPGPIPMGHRYAAQSQSDQTHTLPVSGFESAEKDYRMILSEIQSFISLSSMGTGPGAPLVFAKKESIERIEFQLQWMADKAGVEVFITEVFELELLMLTLDSISNRLYPDNGSDGVTATTGDIISDYLATELLNTTAYDYELNTKCDWHEQREVNHCSLATVNKYRYVMSDHLCPKFHISITPRHLPEQSDKITSTVKVMPNKQFSSNLRGVSRDVPEISTAVQNVSISRGRGISLLKFREPKVERSPVGRGMS